MIRSRIGSDFSIVFSPMSHVRVDGIPAGIGIEEVRSSLEHCGHIVRKIPKCKGSHLNNVELQFSVKKRKITFGITDYDSDVKKRGGKPHCYIRCSPTVLTDACDIIMEVLEQTMAVAINSRAVAVEDTWE